MHIKLCTHLRFFTTRNFLLVATAVFAFLQSMQAVANTTTPERPRAATLAKHAKLAPMMDVVRAGSTLVAVGDHGVILLSDDNGGTWNQAKAVPFDGLLNSVSFADSKHGWAVGHAGAVLNTTDGGRTWHLQRFDAKSDRPLFAVHFFDRRNGVAVGLWSLVLVTQDGGITWRENALQPPPGASRADMSMFHLFPGDDNTLYATSERGFLLQSHDMGASWTYLPTGGAGSLWSGISLGKGRLVVAGVGGNAYFSADGGQTWMKADVRSRGAIVKLAEVRDGLAAITSEGGYLVSIDGARTFQPKLTNPAPVLANSLLPLTDVQSLILTGAGPLLVKADRGK